MFALPDCHLCMRLPLLRLLPAGVAVLRVCTCTPERTCGTIDSRRAIIAIMVSSVQRGHAMAVGSPLGSSSSTHSLSRPTWSLFGSPHRWKCSRGLWRSLTRVRQHTTRRARSSANQTPEAHRPRGLYDCFTGLARALTRVALDLCHTHR